MTTISITKTIFVVAIAFFKQHYFFSKSTRYEELKRIAQFRLASKLDRDLCPIGP